MVLAHLRGRYGRDQPADQAHPKRNWTGLVYGCTKLPSEGHLRLYQRPIFWASAVAVLFVTLNIIFW